MCWLKMKMDDGLSLRMNAFAMDEMLLRRPQAPLVPPHGMAPRGVPWR